MPGVWDVVQNGDIQGMIERTRYVTVFQADDGLKLWRSGRIIGNIVVPEGRRPGKDRDKLYRNMGVREVDRSKTGDEAVFDVHDREENAN